MAARVGPAQAPGMRTRIAMLLLCGSFACSSDDERERVDITRDPSTADDAGDPRQVKPRSPDSGPGSAVGGNSTGGSTSPGLDGGGLDAALSDANANTTDSAASSSFACQSDNDCAIVNVGSCCGYFPRCANADAIFPVPDCNGVSSNCGFPSIDSCRCELGQCISLQAGVRVTYP
jgi:hypothetical protein